MSDCKLQAKGMSSIVQSLWSQLSLSNSGRLTRFQSSERMGGSEIYQVITATLTMKCILNHTSQRCEADCVRRQSWFLGQGKEEWR
jgi:hypothetical protein